MPKKKLVVPDLKPCPCCGATKFYTGHMSSCEVGVSCDQCGLRMSRVYPSEMPKGVRSLSDLDQYLMGMAAERWNRRVD